MPTIKNFPNNADEYIGAENVMKWLHGRTSGVFGAEDNLAVTADDGLSVSVSDGIGWIANDEADGTVFWNDYEQENGTKLSLTIELPDAIFPRIDRVVVSWETINYVAKPSIEILKGTAASSPVPPGLTNDNLNRQISLAQIYVPEAASKISSDNITDERLNEDVCGLVTAGIGVDTSVMQAQFLALLSKIESELANLNAGTEVMLKTEYDPDSEVVESGGIPAYTATSASAAAADAIKPLEALTAMLGQTGASRSNSFIYEHDLGTSFTAEQSADIRAGKFELVRTGGYWTINGRKYWAAHADYRLNCGDPALTTHHMLVIPDKPFYYGVMNDTNVTTGAYYGSKMKTSGLADALATIKADFGADHILTHKVILANAVSNGLSSGWARYDSQIDLMNEKMVYGSHAWGGASHNGFDTGADKSQLALFQARQDLITNRENWWLRDVLSSTAFCAVAADGAANSWGASSSRGVRPAFLIY